MSNSRIFPFTDYLKNCFYARPGHRPTLDGQYDSKYVHYRIICRILPQGHTIKNPKGHLHWESIQYPMTQGAGKPAKGADHPNRWVVVQNYGCLQQIKTRGGQLWEYNVSLMCQRGNLWIIPQFKKIAGHIGFQLSISVKMQLDLSFKGPGKPPSLLNHGRQLLLMLLKSSERLFQLNVPFKL